MVLLAVLGGAATTFLFLHPSVENFVTWGSVMVTLTGAYHWLVYMDSKHPDADNHG